MTPHPALALAATILLGGCGTTIAETASTNPETTSSSTSSPPPTSTTIQTITTPAVATLQAEPVIERTSTIPPDPCAVAEWTVNALPWEWLNLQPAHDAYRLVALNCLGWPVDVVDRWEAFIVEDVIRKESGGCWNLQRKGIVRTYLGCEVAYPNGKASDSGFFQIVGSNYAPGTWLCEEHGFCSANNIIDSPYHSMLAGLLFVEYVGKQPWCYSPAARFYHKTCDITPRYWP